MKIPRLCGYKEQAFGLLKPDGPPFSEKQTVFAELKDSDEKLRKKPRHRGVFLMALNPVYSLADCM
jgi:hypothetical protein